MFRSIGRMYGTVVASGGDASASGARGIMRGSAMVVRVCYCCKFVDVCARAGIHMSFCYKSAFSRDRLAWRSVTGRPGRNGARDGNETG